MYQTHQAKGIPGSYPARMAFRCYYKPETITRALVALRAELIREGGPGLAHVEALLQPRARKVAGAIAGRALYDGRLDPAQALALIRAAQKE